MRKSKMRFVIKRSHACLLRPFIHASLAIVFLYPFASIASTCEQWIAQVVSVQGSVLAQRVGEVQWQPVRLNDTYCPQDKISVKAKSRANIALADSILRLNENTSITLEGVREKRTTLVDLIKGAVYFFSHASRSIEVRTPSTVAGVRGTEFFVSVEDDKTFLSIFEGQVLASNPAGNLTLSSGQSALAEPGKSPALRVVARPRDAVRWALHYPPVINIRPDEFQGGYWLERVRQSSEFYQKGNLQKRYGIVTVGAINLFDEKFQFFDTDVRNPSIQPGRALFARVTLSFP